MAVGATVGAWVLFSSVGLLVQNYMIDARDDRLAGINQAYQALHGEMSHVQKRFLAATEAIEAKHDRLARMLREKQSIESRVKDAATADVSKKAKASNKRLAANTASAPDSSR